jgi:GTP cyclohydrolase III
MQQAAFWAMQKSVQSASEVTVVSAIKLSQSPRHVQSWAATQESTNGSAGEQAIRHVAPE